MISARYPFFDLRLRKVSFLILHVYWVGNRDYKISEKPVEATLGRRWRSNGQASPTPPSPHKRQ
jgi:hypothetical protein